MAGDMRRVVDLLERVEELPEGAAGTLVFGSDARPRGAIFVEDRRICWAAAMGMSRRLTDILRDWAAEPLDDLAIERLVDECRTTGRRIGEVLVERGVVTASALSEALIQHTGESLLALSELPTPRWSARSERFSPPSDHQSGPGVLPGRRDLQRHTARAAADDGVAERGRRRGRRLHPMLGHRRVVPVTQVGFEHVGIRALADVGAWVVSNLDVGQAIEPSANAIVFSEVGGQSIVAWVMFGFLFAVLCPPGPTLPRVLNRYLERVRRST